MNPIESIVQKMSSMSTPQRKCLVHLTDHHSTLTWEDDLPQFESGS